MLNRTKVVTKVFFAKDDILEIQSPLDIILLSLNKNANREQELLLSGNLYP
jgi:hypothetical protein